MVCYDLNAHNALYLDMLQTYWSFLLRNLHNACVFPSNIMPDLQNTMLGIIRNDLAHSKVRPGVPSRTMTPQQRLQFWTIANDAKILVDQLAFPSMAQGRLTSAAGQLIA